MWQSIDVLLVPTAPTHYTIAQMQEDPVALNRNLGAYTNFVNLLDYAAISVPSAIRPDGLPFGITLIGPCGSDWQLADMGQRYHHATGLTQGATGVPLPPPEAIPGLKAAASVKLAVVGAHLSGMPLNGQLVERGATLVGIAQTAPDYKFFALPGTTPPKPGLLRVAPGEGLVHRTGNLGHAVGALRLLRRADPRTLGHRHAGSCRRQQGARFSLRGAGPPRARRTSRTLAAGAPTSPPGPNPAGVPAWKSLRSWPTSRRPLAP